MNAVMNAARPRIVFMINSLAGGGAERIITRLIACSKHRALSHDLHLVLLDSETEAYAVPAYVTVHRLDAQRSSGKSLARVVRLLRRLRPAACLSFLTRSNVANVAAASLLGFPAIISERVNPSGHHPKTLSGGVARLLTRMAYPRADAIICPSCGVATDLVDRFGVPVHKVSVIANPVDADELHDASRQPMLLPTLLPTTRPYFVAMGRLVENKNFALLLDAFAASSCDLDLVIIGDGPQRPAIEARIRHLRLDHRVCLTGFLSNPFPVVARARAFVLSSKAEGFPNALVEAMALGVPVIAADCPSGPAEILSGGRYGLLVPVDDPGAMAVALDRMAEDDTHARFARLSAQGAERYGLQPAVDAFWHVLDQTLASRRA